MKSYVQSGLAAFMLLASFAVQAQECTPFQFWVMNQAGESNPVLVINYLISNANGMPTADGVWEVGANGLEADFCLAPGCYSIAISGDGVSPESVAVDLFQSDFVQMLEFTAADGEGVWDATFCIEQGWEYNCPEAIDYAAGEGCTWAFEIGSFQEGEEVMWNFGDGSEPIWGGHFIEYEFETAGTYEVNAFFTSYDCPMGVELQTVIEVSGCGESECVLEMEVNTEDGMWYTFSIPDELANNEIQWYIDGQPIEGAYGTSFEAGFDFNPYWSVCVDVYTEACPEGMEACYSNPEGGCPDAGIAVDSEGCYYVFSIGNESPAEVQWFIDGEFVEWSGGAFDWTFESGGWHDIMAVYYSSTCPGETYVTEVNTEGCGEGDPCPLDLVWNEVECNQFFIEALNQPEGATLFWTLDGEPYDYGSAEMIFTFEEDGCHVFGVGYETPECPQGAFAEVEICSDCTGMEDCEVELEYEELSDGIYLFSAYTSDGELFGGEIGWWTNGMNVGSGNPFAWTWDVEEPQGVNMCIGYGSWGDCAGGEACIELETSGMACEEIQLVLNGSWTADINWSFELGFQAVIDGWEIAGWSFEEAWSAEGAISDTLNVCVPPACFDVFWGWDAANVDVEALLISVLIAGMDPVDLFDWFEPFNESGFGLLPDCMETVETPEIEREVLNVWPNPASHAVQWKVPEDATGGEWSVYAADGRWVHGERTTAMTGTWNVADWPCGLYHAIFVSDGPQTLHQQLVVFR
jgi:hypothetical protein